MAVRPQIPNWRVENLNKPNEYSTEFIVDGVKYVNVTDIVTGQRWVYATGLGGTRTLITSTTANGTVTKGPAYDAAANNYTKINSENKKLSIYIIDRTSTSKEKGDIGKGSEYKSIFANTSSGITTTSVVAGGVVQVPNPNAKNPIIPIGEYISYPSKISPQQDRIVFTAVEIKPRTDSNLGLSSENSELEETFNAFQFPGPEYIQVGGPVILPIQAPIQDQNTAEWAPDSISAIDALLYNSALEIIDGKPGDGRQSIQNLQNAGAQVLKAATTNVGKLQRYFAGQAAGVNNVVTRTDGVILNPNLELIFQAPQLRPFSFTFKLSARSKEEGVKIKKIIKYFKRHMAVKMEKGIFLKAPNVFTIMYQKGEGTIHPSIGRISPEVTKRACALTNFTVDYTPLGSYMTFKDEEATMVSYTIGMQFQEIEPIYDKDYEDSHPIGY